MNAVITATQGASRVETRRLRAQRLGIAVMLRRGLRASRFGTAVMLRHGPQAPRLGIAVMLGRGLRASRFDIMVMLGHGLRTLRLCIAVKLGRRLRPSVSTLWCHWDAASSSALWHCYEVGDAGFEPHVLTLHLWLWLVTRLEYRLCSLMICP